MINKLQSHSGSVCEKNISCGTELYHSQVVIPVHITPLSEFDFMTRKQILLHSLQGNRLSELELDLAREEREVQKIKNDFGI